MTANNLEAKGNPLHRLRKQFGSEVATDFGLFDAQKLLGNTTPTACASPEAAIEGLRKDPFRRDRATTRAEGIAAPPQAPKAREIALNGRYKPDGGFINNEQIFIDCRALPEFGSSETAREFSPTIPASRSLASLLPKAEFSPTIISATSDIEIAHHNEPREERGRGRIYREYFLPASPEVIGDQLRHLFPRQRINQQTIAKLCMLIGEAYQIAKKQKRGNNCFSVSNTWAENILSRLGGRRPLAILDALGITTIKRKHRATICPASTVRQFVHSSFKPYRLHLTGIAARESGNSGKRGKLRREADPGYTWVQQSMERASLPLDVLATYRGMPKHASNAANFEQGLRPQSWKGSFRWNSICQMPEEIRNELRFDTGTSVTRLDISCSFGIMLPWLFADEIAHLARIRKIDLHEQNRRLAECDKLREFLSSVDFYKSLAEGRSRQDIKDAFQRYLNATETDGLAKIIGRRFADKFPRVDALIRRRRGAATKTDVETKTAQRGSPFRELQGRQNEVIQAVVKKCREEAIPCIPVWDELIVPFQNRMQVLNWLHEELYERTGVRSKVGGIRMSSPETKAVPCPTDLCPHCWANKIVTHLTSPFPCSHVQPAQSSRSCHEHRRGRTWLPSSVRAAG